MVQNLESSLARWEQSHRGSCQLTNRVRKIEGGSTASETSGTEWSFMDAQICYPSSNVQDFERQSARYSGQVSRWLGLSVKWLSGTEVTSGAPHLPENLVRAPEWLMGRWTDAGATGRWNSNPPQAVIAHVNPSRGGDGPAAKYGVMKIMAWWHWGRVTQVLGSNILSLPVGAPVRVLAFAPQVNQWTATRAQLGVQVQHLLHAAAVLGRQPVFPEVSCKSGWIRRRSDWQLDDRELVPHPIDDTRILAWGPASDLRCVSVELMSQGCHTIGMPAYDFYHLMRTRLWLNEESSWMPTPQNTLFWDHMPATRPVANFVQGMGAASFEDVITQWPHGSARAVDVSATQLLAAEEALSNMEVVFLGAPVRVSGISEDVLDELKSTQTICNPRLAIWEELTSSNN